MQHTHHMQNDEGQSGQSIRNIVYCRQAVQHMDKEALEKIISPSHYSPRSMLYLLGPSKNQFIFTKG